MIAALDDFAVFQYHDRIRVSNSGKPVGDDLGQASVLGITHGVFFLGIGKDALNVQDQRAARRICAGEIWMRRSNAIPK